MSDRLFSIALEPRTRLSLCVDLVPYPGDVCLRCGGPVTSESIGQPALFRHGGYGATRMSTFLLCRDQKCRGVRLSRVIEVRPERRAS